MIVWPSKGLKCDSIGCGAETQRLEREKRIDWREKR